MRAPAQGQGGGGDAAERIARNRDGQVRDARAAAAERKVERDEASSTSTTESARRHEVEGQLRESERELRATRERAEDAAISAAQKLELQQARAADAAATAADEIERARGRRRSSRIRSLSFGWHWQTRRAIAPWRSERRRSGWRHCRPR